MTHSAAILARGLGTRMRRTDRLAELTAEQAAQADVGVKGMISVGRPFLDYLLSALADADITEVTLVIGPEHSAVRDYFECVCRPQRVRLRFAIQEHAIGTANAVTVAADAIENNSFIVLNADNYYPVEAYRRLAKMQHAGVIAFDRDVLVREGNFDAKRVRAFAILDVAADGTLSKIVEKPGATFDLGAPEARWVGMNCWKVSSELVDACRRVPLSIRGEYELPEAVSLAVSEGVIVQVEKMSALVLDLSQRSDIAAVVERLASVEAFP